jgi:formylglycine-generating enzyme
MSREDMVQIPAGRFRMGSADFYPEEGPVRKVEVDAFAIDRGPVTVAQFARFVKETGYLTLAERAPNPAQYPDADPSLLHAGSVVFHPTPGPVPLNDASRWWAYVPGTSWQAPWGPHSDNSARADHPVTHVAFTDAEAYGPGPTSSCRARPSGSTRRAADSMVRSSPGAIASGRRAS